jgi:dihydroxyacetone kinase phosphotransfer subunit
MVGIVIVSHSARLADGVVELAREMAGPDVAIVAAGGLDLPDRPLGTDAALIERAIDEAWADDGVLVLMDLGSAVMSAEMAAEMLPDERRSRVLLCEAPLVEGAVAAAVAARLGDPLDQVAAEARGGLAGKVAHLASAPNGDPPPPAVEPDGAPAQEPDAASAQEPDGAPALELRITVAGRLGLHARPAARFVQTAGQFDANVTAENITAPAGPVSARSLNGVATLGVLQGHEVLVRASGPQAAQVLAALRDLADRNFDEPAESGSPPGPAAAAPSGPAAPAPSGSRRTRTERPRRTRTERLRGRRGRYRGDGGRGGRGRPARRRGHPARHPRLTRPGRRRRGPSAAVGGAGTPRAGRRSRRRAGPAGRRPGGHPT